MESFEYDADAPVPMVRGVSLSGLVVIEWDMPMKEIDDLDKIATTKIAVSNELIPMNFKDDFGVG